MRKKIETKQNQKLRIHGGKSVFGDIDIATTQSQK